MSISSISINHFRNLQDTSLLFNPRLNLITGLNASGKTSLLEAVYFLSTGRSFRSRKVQNIIARESISGLFTLFGVMTDTNNKRPDNKVGIQKTILNKTKIRLNGENIFSASQLARLSPVVIIDPTSFELLTGAPNLRRQFLDWGVFHVEHSFSITWNNYIFCLKQRNTLLRAAKIDAIQLDTWDAKIAHYGDLVHTARASYAEVYVSELRKLFKLFSIDDGLTVKYFKGWDKKLSYLEFLRQYRAKDIFRKFTQFGPHRADMRVLLGGKGVQDVFSRGQQKLLIIAMYLANIKCILKIANINTVVLIDDITAELDRNNVDVIFDSLLTLDTQIIMTALDASISESEIFTNNTCNMFHVEHGLIKVKE